MKKVSIGTKPQLREEVATAADEWVKSRQAEEPEKMKRLTIDIPESLHRRIKATCAQGGMKMADQIRVLLEERFNKE